MREWAGVEPLERPYGVRRQWRRFGFSRAKVASAPPQSKAIGLSAAGGKCHLRGGWPRSRKLAAAMLALGGVAPWGCVSPSAPPRMRTPLIGVRYRVEPLRMAGGESPAGAARRDFAQMRELGLDTVWVDHVRDADCEGVVRAARDNDLAVVLTDGVLVHYVRTGQCPAQPSAPNDLVRDRLSRGVLTEPVTAVYIGRLADEGSARRAARVAAGASVSAPGLSVIAAVAPGFRPPEELPEVLVYLREPCFPEGGAEADRPPTEGVPLERPALQRVPIRRRWADPATAVRHWLGLYHAGLANGGTRGLLLDAYAELPGLRGGLVDSSGALTAERSAAVKRIVDRARHWGGLLAGMLPQPVAGVPSHDADVRVLLFARDRRRFVLVWNTSWTRFVRSRVAIPEPVAGGLAARAVEVQPESGPMGGAVVFAHQGKLDLRIELSPGDATLYELF